jgi:hypothetical protein
LDVDQELNAHILEWILQFNLLGDGHAIVRYGGRAPLLIERYVPPARAERRLDRLRQGVDALLEGLARARSSNTSE